MKPLTIRLKDPKLDEAFRVIADALGTANAAGEEAIADWVKKKLSDPSAVQEIKQSLASEGASLKRIFAKYGYPYPD